MKQNNLNFNKTIWILTKQILNKKKRTKIYYLKLFNFFYIKDLDPEPDPEPDPDLYVGWIRSRTKVVRIRNTAWDETVSVSKKYANYCMLP